VNPSVGLLLQHLPGVQREAGAVVAEVKPPFLSLSVVGRHGTRQVQLLALVPQHERGAADANRLTCPPFARGESVELTAEKMDPHVPVRRDSKNPSQPATKEAACKMVLGAKLWSSTP
jgi:hypothetical protein